MELVSLLWFLLYAFHTKKKEKNTLASLLLQFTVHTLELRKSLSHPHKLFQSPESYLRLGVSKRLL